MVTELLLQRVVDLVSWILSAFPFPSVPSWFSTISSGVTYLHTWAGAVARWLPLGIVAAIFATYVAVHAVSLLVKLARQVLSYLTLGGGAT